MKPLVIPASTANMFYAACATTIIAWAIEQFAHIKIPAEVASAITGLLTLVAGHLTTDTPSPAVAQAAMDKVSKEKS